jgi:hypothetical protein
MRRKSFNLLKGFRYAPARNQARHPQPQQQKAAIAIIAAWASVDRHRGQIDALKKLIGGALGIFSARAILWFARNSWRFQN